MREEFAYHFRRLWSWWPRCWGLWWRHWRWNSSCSQVSKSNLYYKQPINLGLLRGSTCACHSCACEKGQINHCSKGYKSGGGGYGKNYCYGSMEGEYCTCDFCKCKTGFGVLGSGTGYGGGIGHHGGFSKSERFSILYIRS